MSESLYVAEFLFFDTFLMHFLFQTVLFFFSVQLDWNVRISSKNYESLSYSINKWIRFNTAILVVVLLKLVKTGVWTHKFYVFESDLCWLRRLNCLINFWSNFYSNHSEQWEVKKLSSLWKFKYWCEKSNEFCLRPYLPVCDPLFWWCFSKFFLNFG